MYRALCEATGLTYESQAHLRRYAPNKGLRPLRRFAAIPYTLDRLPYSIGRRSFIFEEKETITMEKSRKELQKELGEATAKLEQYQHQQQRLANRISDYKEVQRRKRNHRLITRGADVENVAPEMRGMSQTAFRLLVEEIFSLPEVAALVRRAIDQQEGE